MNTQTHSATSNRTPRHLLTGLRFALFLTACTPAAPASNQTPSTSPAMPPIAQKLIDHADSLRIVLQYVGPTDKPAFPSILLVQSPNTPPSTQPLPTTPYLCKIPPELARSIVERTAAAGLFGDAHKISEADAVTAGGYALSFSAANDIKWSRLIDPAGATSFRELVADLASHSDPQTNRDVRRCLRLPESP